MEPGRMSDAATGKKNMVISFFFVVQNKTPTRGLPSHASHENTIKTNDLSSLPWMQIWKNKEKPPKAPFHITHSGLQGWDALFWGTLAKGAKSNETLCRFLLDITHLASPKRALEMYANSRFLLRMPFTFSISCLTLHDGIEFENCIWKHCCPPPPPKKPDCDSDAVKSYWVQLLTAYHALLTKGHSTLGWRLVSGLNVEGLWISTLSFLNEPSKSQEDIRLWEKPRARSFCPQSRAERDKWWQISTCFKQTLLFNFQEYPEIVELSCLVIFFCPHLNS